MVDGWSSGEVILLFAIRAGCNSSVMGNGGHFVFATNGDENGSEQGEDRQCRRRRRLALVWCFLSPFVKVAGTERG